MAVQPDTVTGTLTTTAGSVNFTTVGTQLLTREHMPGDRFLVNGLELQIATITGENAGTLTEVCPPEAAVSGFPVRLRWQPDGARVAAQTRNLIDLLGNGTLQSLADIDANADDMLIFLGPNTLVTIPKTDLIQGVDYNVQVDTLPERDAYDNEPEGFAVLVSDTGDGRAAVYIRNSATPGEWSAPSYITGEKGDIGNTGPAPDIAGGTTTTVSPSTPADVEVVPDGSGGYILNFDIPQGVQGIQGEQGNGLDIDASGPTADRTLYDNEPEGFIFLDTETGQIYIREGAAGNWSDPLSFEGPPGADGSTITTTTGVGNGTAGPYTLDEAPIGLDNVISASISGVLQYDFVIGGTGPYTITFSIVVPTGVAWQVKQSGPLSIGSADSVADGVINSVAITNDPTQQNLILQKIGGVKGPASSADETVAIFDGTTGKIIKDSGILIADIGSGDVVGPSSSVDERIAVFDGTTGKLIKDGGISIAEISGIPLGTPMPIISNILPEGYLWLEGGTYDPLVYPEFATYMTDAGYASGQLPDWRNRVPRGFGTLTSAVGTTQEDAIRNITGNIGRSAVGSQGLTIDGASGVFKNGTARTGNIQSAAGSGFDIGFDASLVVPTATENRVKAFIVRWAIKAYGAIINAGTADLVAIEQALTHAIRDDLDQNAQSKSSAFKINILKNTLQVWEQIGPIIILSANAATVTWTNLGIYKELRMRATMGSTAAAILVSQVGDGNGSNWHSGTNSYANQTGYFTTSSSSAAYVSSTQFWISAGRTNANNFAKFDLEIENFNATGNCFMYSKGAYRSDPSGVLVSGSNGGYSATSTARDSLRILGDTGSILAGSRFILEGIRG